MLLNQVSRRRKKNTEGSWAVSYVDMLTLLLCFFIIFYNNSKNTGEKTLFDQIAVNMDGRSPNNVAGSRPVKTTKVDLSQKSIQLAPYEVVLLNTIKTNLIQDFDANITSKDRGIEINFEGVSFFSSGQTRLRPEGMNQISKIIEKLAPHKDSIHITVQGHTDPTKTSKKSNYSDNWELSVLRATSVLKLFIKSGYSQESLSAEGFADTRSERALASISKEELARMRRITLRIEPVQVNQ